MLILGAGRIAASEQRDFAAASAAFQDGMWNRAEQGFAEFIKNHPASARVPEAALMEAQAEFKQGKFSQSIALLEANGPTAAGLGDQYAYWIGQAQFTNDDYSAAAQTFARLANAFTNSPWQLDGVINEAASRAKLGQWGRVDALLQKSQLFQSEAKTNAADGRVMNGRLLLAQAFLAENHPDSAIAVLQGSEAFKSSPELDWRRLYMLCQGQLADGNTNEALALTTNLMDVAARANDLGLAAQSVAEQARILETLGRLSDAVSAYQKNLTNNAPTDWQRQAVMKVAELSAAQTNFSTAENSLDNFLAHFTNSPGADLVVLSLGELHLKSYVILHPLTDNDLLQAQSYFNRFIDTFTNSALLGKAYLDRGWCFWIEKDWADSAADFQNATAKLPPSLDLAVARFKLSDAEYRENDFAAARDNYLAVANYLTNNVSVNSLGAEALYQTLRVCVEMRDLSGADNALIRILKIYPGSSTAESGSLIDGEAWSDLGHPAKARAQFQQFEQTFTNSTQVPYAELAIARTYEQETNWPMAISIYNSWIKRFATDVKFPDVEFARAWDNFQSGRESVAFSQFTNFLAEFSSNSAAPVVEWWLGDYYSSQGDWVNAQKNYETIFQYWPANGLAYPAEFMAGRAAMGRQGYEEAKAYFRSMAADSNCPPQLDAQAWFAYGDVLMQEPSPDANNPYTNYLQAVSYFQVVCQQYAGSEQAALAWGEIANCYYQVAAQYPAYYTNAADAYNQVIASPAAEVAARSQAEVGLGMVFEKRAVLDPANQNAFLQAALNCYLDVFFGKNLRDRESADPLWVKEAGLHALPLMDTLGTGDVNKFIDQMENALPQLKDYLEKKRIESSRPKGA
ncbi:MAG TPA: tetratricopeptide repeat protein [Candidatus Acidoferrum sp.]|nr:tetratricopeptide repeat protein [Candidatus Acidoferrum sp.]